MDSPARKLRRTSRATTNGTTPVSSPSRTLRQRKSKVDYNVESVMDVLMSASPGFKQRVGTSTKSQSVSSPKGNAKRDVVEPIERGSSSDRESSSKKVKKRKPKEIWTCEIITDDDSRLTLTVPIPTIVDSDEVLIEAEAISTPSSKTPSKQVLNRSGRDRTISSSSNSSLQPPAARETYISKNDLKLQTIENNTTITNATPSKSKSMWSPARKIPTGSPYGKGKQANKILKENNIEGPPNDGSDSLNPDEEMEISIGLENFSSNPHPAHLPIVQNSLQTSVGSFVAKNKNKHKNAVVNSCSVVVNKLVSSPLVKGTNSPKTPSENKNLAVSQVTPSRSSLRLQSQLQAVPIQAAVVRRLDASLSEASCSSGKDSPSPNKSIKRPTRNAAQRKNYNDEYFDYPSEDSAGSAHGSPTGLNSSDEDDDSSSSDSDASVVDSEDEAEENCRIVAKLKSPVSAQTPSKGTPKKLLLQIENRTPCLTPKVSQAISKISGNDFSPRRTPDIKNVRNTPTSESYFTAEKRIRFKSELAVRKMENMKKIKESKKGPKKPRKGNRQGIDRSLAQLPLVAPNFSVSKELAKIPLDSMEQFVNPWQEEHGEALEKLHLEICGDFPRWIILLKEGFNIMLHGYGSKQPIYDAFSEFLSSTFLVVSINGLFPKFSPRKFLLNFIEALDLTSEIKITGSNMHFMTEELVVKLSERKQRDDSPVFIYAMNLDIMAVRHHQMLTCICALARVPWIHVIASSDHVNTGLGISPLENLQLNMAWLDCTTFVPYSNELIWNSNVLGAHADGTTAKNSIEHIFKSLTSNSKKAFGLLAGLQLQKLKVNQTKVKSYQGVEFRELFRLCRESFIAHSELVLKSLLTEFIDHKLVHYSGKGKHDDAFLIIDLDEDTLEKYVENY